MSSCGNTNRSSRFSSTDAGKACTNLTTNHTLTTFPGNIGPWEVQWLRVHPKAHELWANAMACGDCRMPTVVHKPGAYAVTLYTSSSVVIPDFTFSIPSVLNVFIPMRFACSRSSDNGTPALIRSIIASSGIRSS
jgi:hypothetical protein